MESRLDWQEVLQTAIACKMAKQEEWVKAGVTSLPLYVVVTAYVRSLTAIIVTITISLTQSIF